MLAIALTAALATAQATTPQAASITDTALTCIRNSIADGIGLTGIDANWPEASALPQEAPLVVMALPAAPSEPATDNYAHSLYIYQLNQPVFVLQIGGIAGTQRFFGPIQMPAHCSRLASAP